MDNSEDHNKNKLIMKIIDFTLLGAIAMVIVLSILRNLNMWDFP